MDTPIINSARAAKKAAWRRELHDWYNEWARAQEWAAQVTPITEEEMGRLAEIVDGLVLG